MTSSPDAHPTRREARSGNESRKGFHRALNFAIEMTDARDNC
jgi:hypothetical protein